MKVSEEIAQLTQSLDAKNNRWLELADLME
jgi:hypothetical protein